MILPDSYHCGTLRLPAWVASCGTYDTPVNTEINILSTLYLCAKKSREGSIHDFDVHIHGQMPPMMSKFEHLVRYLAVASGRTHVWDQDAGNAQHSQSGVHQLCLLKPAQKLKVHGKDDVSAMLL